MTLSNVPRGTRPMRTRGPQADNLMTTGMMTDVIQQSNGMAVYVAPSSHGSVFWDPNKAPKATLTDVSTWTDFTMPNASGATITWGFPWRSYAHTTGAAMTLQFASEVQEYFDIRLTLGTMLDGSQSGSGDPKELLLNNETVNMPYWKTIPYHAYTDTLYIYEPTWDASDQALVKPQIRLNKSTSLTIDEGGSVYAYIATAFIQDYENPL